MARIFFVLALVLQSALAFAADWKDMANGEHSIKALGEDFYVEVPVRKIPEAQVQLVFVNDELAKKLGLELPEDPKALEAMLKDLFAWEVDPTGKSEKKWFATYYQDSAEKGPGHANGDGRALWTGELKLHDADGKPLNIDVVQKGVGATPLAWTNNKSHSNGKQTTNELVYSGILSLANLRNQLDSTGDLLGFRVIRDGEVTTQTVRVGTQTRPAHLVYHSDHPANFKKIFDYIIRRDLGLSTEEKVTPKIFVQWFVQFASNGAEEAARFFDLQAIQESPTRGNKTTRGGSIDLGGVRYLDAYHVAYRHLNGKIAVGEQNTKQKNYLGMIWRAMNAAKYSNFIAAAVANPDIVKAIERIYDSSYIGAASRNALVRLGLSEAEIGRLPTELRHEFAVAVDKVSRAKGNRQVNMILGNEGVVPAAFDIRRVLSSTMMLMAAKDQNPEALKEIFRVDRSWASAAETDHADIKAAYLDVVSRIVQALSEEGVRAEWMRRARALGANSRLELTQPNFWIKYEGPIMKLIESGHSNFQEISKAMSEAADSLTDKGLSERSKTSLKPGPARPAPVRTCRDIFASAG